MAAFCFIPGKQVAAWSARRCWWAGQLPMPAIVFGGNDCSYSSLRT
jgi:hypothetical protein